MQSTARTSIAMAYFDNDDDDDDDDEYVCDFDDVDEEHVGDFDAFSPEHSQYRAFSLDGGGLGGPGDKGRCPLRSIDFRYISIFFYTIHVLSLVIEIYD